MQFLKKHITELCFMLLLCGTLWGAVQLIVSGHIFNGDFALYIRQAQSIQYGDMQQVFSDMQEMITHSTYQRFRLYFTRGDILCYYFRVWHCLASTILPSKL